MQVSKMGYLAKLDNVEQSPSTDGYRNKCEFAIGINPETKKLIVGFKLDPKSSNSLVGPIEHLRHVPPQMKHIAKLLGIHLSGTGYKHYDSLEGRGAWLSAIVKVTQKKETMLIVNFNPRDMSKPELLSLKNGLKHFFDYGEGAQCNLTSLYVSERTGKTPVSSASSWAQTPSLRPS
jgi:tRNA (uracil-5-)-methyltransferase